MSEVMEVTPVSCPACGADWTTPGSHRPGWGYVPTEGNCGPLDLEPPPRLDFQPYQFSNGLMGSGVGYF